MAKKLYKNKFGREDLLLLNWYIQTLGAELLMEIWVNGSDDGDVYHINKGTFIELAILKIYDIIGYKNKKKVAELLMREPNGELSVIYHTEKNRDGISYETLKYAKDAYNKAIKTNLSLELSMLYNIYLSRGYTKDGAYTEAYATLSNKYPNKDIDSIVGGRGC